MLSAAEWETFTPTINELIKWDFCCWEIWFFEDENAVFVCLFEFFLYVFVFVNLILRCVLLQERAGRANYWEKPGGQLALKYKLVSQCKYKYINADTNYKCRYIYKLQITNTYTNTNTNSTTNANTNWNHWGKLGGHLWSLVVSIDVTTVFFLHFYTLWLSTVVNYLAIQDNEFELVFVLGYQKMLALAYLDKVKQSTIKSGHKSLNK